MTGPAARIRLDKWLWHGRFFKTRTLAAKAVADGRVRVNSERVVKTSHAVGAGDVLTFPQGRIVRVVRVEAIGVRRGPATEAAMLYTDLTPPSASSEPRVGKRPTKRDRRALDALRGDDAVD